MTSSEHDSRASRSAGPRSLSPETLKRPKTSTSHTTDMILKLHKCQDALRANQDTYSACRILAPRGLWSAPVLASAHRAGCLPVECDLGRRRWRACSLPFIDRIGNGFHSTRYMCPRFYGPRLSSRRKPVDDTTRLIRGREGEREREKINSSRSCRCPGR